MSKNYNQNMHKQGHDSLQAKQNTTIMRYENHCG